MEECIFHFMLNSLQIGYLHSHLSILSLFLVPRSARFYVLVDNRPLLGMNVEGHQKWFSFIQTPPHRNVPRPVSGFIVLEVLWDNVRGMNYLNQLQSDASLAVEARFMKRWDFDSISQAVSCLSSWFSGTPDENHLMKECLDVAIGEVFHDAEETFSSTESPEESLEDVNEPNLINTKIYTDVLVLIKFEHRDLPSILKETIISDCRLLNLLEYGLPFWVIFLQSYPGFSHLYRPWMCPLMRTLYVVMSFVTVLIGFYDLYKNIPIAYRWLIGPLLDWIETWDMISRIRYLGTMWILQIFQNDFLWILIIVRTGRSFISMYTQPLAIQFWDIFGFLHPAWVLCVDNLGGLYELISSIFIMIVENFLPQIWFFIALFWSNVTPYLYPMLGNVKEIVFSTHGLLLTVADYVGFFYTGISEYIAEIWLSIIRIRSATGENLTAGQPSMLQTLWNDIFSQVYPALRRILNGLVTCITACKRHRDRGRQFDRRQTSPSTASEHSNLTNGTRTQPTRRNVQFHRNEDVQCDIHQPTSFTYTVILFRKHNSRSFLEQYILE